MRAVGVDVVGAKRTEQVGGHVRQEVALGVGDHALVAPAADSVLGLLRLLGPKA